MNKKKLTELETEIVRHGDEIALAKTNGSMKAREYSQHLSSNMENGTAYVKNQAKVEAKAFSQSLALLVLRNYVIPQDQADYTYFYNEFENIEMKEGNGAYFTANIPTGHGTYSTTPFFPSTVTPTVDEQFSIQMYQKNATTGVRELTPQAFQFKKSQTLLAESWIPLFTGGGLVEYIALLTAQMEFTFNKFLFHKCVNLLVASTPQATITGTAPNMFEAFATEILPLIREMMGYNSKFNYDANSKALKVSNIENIRIAMSPRNMQVLSSGIATQLFNAQFLNLKGVLDDSNIRLFYNKFVISGENVEITISEDPYVLDTQIIIWNTDAIKIITQVNTSESQEYTENLAVQLNKHTWGALDILPWGQVVKYNNANLPVLPGSPTTGVIKKSIKNVFESEKANV